jgi:hypothetical protein
MDTVSFWIKLVASAAGGGADPEPGTDQFRHKFEVFKLVTKS